MLFLQRILLFSISFVCFFLGGVLISDQIDEDAHEDFVRETHHIIHQLLPISKGTPYPSLIRLIVGLTTLISGCVFIWFRSGRSSNLLLLLGIMLAIATTRGYFNLEYEVPAALAAVLVLSLYLDSTERKTKLTDIGKKID